MKLYETIQKMLDNTQSHYDNQAELVLFDFKGEPSITYKLNCKELKKLLKIAKKRGE